MADERRDGETEERILDAAHAVFLRRGTAGARMKEIAREAGVNQALLHYYFRSKGRLAEAVFLRAAARLLPPVFRTLTSDRPIEEKVERVIELELENLSRSPFLPGYILSELNHHPERIRQLAGSLVGMPPEAAGRRALEVLGGQLEEAAEKGEIRPIAPEQFIVNLISLCIFPFAARPMLSVLLGLEGEAFDAFIERRKRELTDFFLGALRP